MLKKPDRLTLDERVARGEAARLRVPPSSHSGWVADPDRRDPVELIEEQNARRDEDLVPVRHGRMMVSPFTFYRGTARVMAEDLAGTPTAGFEVQLCGDAHLSNFGAFASPERQLVFDINDFDETLPGPFEYDVKRLAASLTVAARNNGYKKSEARTITTDSVAAYHESMAQFAGMQTLDVWYARASEEDLLGVVARAASDAGTKGAKAQAKAKQARKAQKRLEKGARKARARTSMQALSKLAEVVDGGYRITSVPPVVVPARELDSTYGFAPDEMEDVVLTQLTQYRQSLQPDRQLLLDRFEMVDWARKVVGVGSVGTRAFIALFQGRDEGDPLFLQGKEATASVLEGALRRSRFRQPGERVVQGQRLMQASSDIFLGWSRRAEEGRYFYWRQLRDMKASAEVELMTPEGMRLYGRICAWTLARAHARSGDPVAIAAYLGTDAGFETSVADFAERYADQTERDFAAFTEAIARSRIQAVEGI